MANKLPPIPLKTPLVDKAGMMNPVWVKWFIEIYKRASDTGLAIPNPAAPGATYTQAEAAAMNNAIISILGILRTHFFIENS